MTKQHFYILHKYFSEKIIYKILEKMCIFDSSTAKPETLLIEFWYDCGFACKCVCVCEFGFNVAFNNFSVISRRCLVATELSALFYSAASLKYHVPDT